MDLDGDRMNRQQAAQHVEERVRLVPGHLHFPARDVGKFVQNLHADRAAAGNGRFRPIGLRGVAGREVDEDVGIEKLTGIRLVPVEFEIGRETAAECAKALQ